jgi:hypothetical protein
MVLRNIFIALGCTTVLAWTGLAVADEYRPDEFLSLDLSSAVLSPKPLGPAAGFTPGPLDVTVDRGSNSVHASTEPATEPKVESRIAPQTEPKTALKSAPESKFKSESKPKPVVHSIRVAHARGEQPSHAARTKLAQHRRNPLDAQARDTRIQVWPCRSGGICNWKR